MQHLFGPHIPCTQTNKWHKRVEEATFLAIGQAHFLPFVETVRSCRTSDIYPWSSPQKKVHYGFAGIAVPGLPESTLFPFPYSLLGLRAHSSGNRAGRLQEGCSPKQPLLIPLVAPDSLPTENQQMEQEMMQFLLP